MAEEPKRITRETRVLTREELVAPKAPEPPASNFLTQMWNAAGGKLAPATSGISGLLKKVLGDSVKEKDIQTFVPVVAALGVAGTGFALFEPISRAGQGVMGGIKKLVTGFGYFEKIPLLGGAFTLLGSGVEALGAVAGAVVTGALSLLTFRALQVPPSPPLPLGKDLSDKKPVPPVILRQPAVEAKSIERVRQKSRAAKEKLRDEFRPETVKDAPAEASDIAKIKKLLGEQGLKDFNKKAFGSEGAADGSHPQMTKGKAQALVQMIESSRAEAAAVLRQELDKVGKKGRVRKAAEAQIRKHKILWPVRKLLLTEDAVPLTEAQKAAEEARLLEAIRNGIGREAGDLAAEGKASVSSPDMAARLSNDPALDEAIAKAQSVKEKVYSTEAKEAVRDTLQWMRGYGNAAQHDAANRAANDPATLDSLLDLYEHAGPEAQKDLGMLERAALTEGAKAPEAPMPEAKPARRARRRSTLESREAEVLLERDEAEIKESLLKRRNASGGEVPADPAQLTEAELTEFETEMEKRSNRRSSGTLTRAEADALAEADRLEITKSLLKQRGDLGGEPVVDSVPLSESEQKKLDAEMKQRQSKRRFDIEGADAKPSDGHVQRAGEARARANIASRNGPTAFSSEAREAVGKTLEWLQRPGAKLHNKVAAEIVADPNRLADLLELYETTDAGARQADVGLLTRAALAQSRKAMLAEAVRIARAANPDMPTKQLNDLAQRASEALEGLQAEKGPNATQQRAGENVTASQIAEAMVGKAGTAGEAAVPAADAHVLSERIVELAKDAAPREVAKKPVSEAGKGGGGKAISVAFDLLMIKSVAEQGIQRYMEGGKTITPGDVLETRGDGSYIQVVEAGKTGHWDLTQPMTLQQYNKAREAMGEPTTIMLVDPSEMGKLTTQGGQGIGASINLTGHGSEFTKLASAETAGSVRKLGGRVMIGFYLAEQTYDAGKDINKGDYGKATATAAGGVSTAAIWVAVPGGFLVGTAPSRLAKEIEAAHREGRNVDADAIFLETLPGMAFVPVKEADQVIDDMMSHMPKNVVLDLFRNKDGTPNNDGTPRSVNLDEMYLEYPQYSKAVLSLPLRGNTALTEEKIANERKKMLEDPIYTWQKIAEAHGMKFSPGEAGQKEAGNMLAEYAAYTDAQLRPEAISTRIFAIGSVIQNWIGNSSELFDAKMNTHELAMAAREIKEYCDKQYASKDNPFRNMATLGQAPVTTEIPGVGVLPIEPLSVLVPDNLPKGVDTRKVWMQKNENTIRKMLSENAGGLMAAESYREWLQFDVQRYHNVVTFLKESRELLGNTVLTVQPTETRRKLFDVMTLELGLSRQQANCIIPNAPKERITFFAGTGGIQEDGYNFSESLITFAREYEAYHGVGSIPIVREDPVSHKKQQHVVAFADMELAEQRAWLESALNHYRKMLHYYTEHVGGTPTEFGGGPAIDYGNRNGGFSPFNDILYGREQGEREVNKKKVKYEEDHKMLRDTIGNKVIAKIEKELKIEIEIGKELKIGSGKEAAIEKELKDKVDKLHPKETVMMLDAPYPNTEFHERTEMVNFLQSALDESGRRMQGHMERLQQASSPGGTIDAYKGQARFMEASIKLADEGLVLLASNKIGEGKDTIKGGKTPASGDWIAFHDMTTSTDHYMVGAWNEKGGFHAKTIVSSDGKTSVGADIDLDLRDPKHFSVNHRLVQAMDVLSSREQARHDHVKDFNEAAVVYDKAGLKLISTDRTVASSNSSKGAANPIRPGEWIMLEDKKSGATLIVEGEWKRTTERGISEATQSFVARRILAKDGTLLMDEAAVKAMAEPARNFTIDKKSPPPIELFAALRDKQAKMGVVLLNPGDRPKMNDIPAMEVAAALLSNMGITVAGNAQILTLAGNLEQQATAAVGSGTTEMMQGIREAKAVMLPTRSTSDTGRNGNGAPV